MEKSRVIKAEYYKSKNTALLESPSTFYKYRSIPP